MAGNELALKLVVGMADYHYKRSKALVEKLGEDHWQMTLRIEFGGMNDVRQGRGGLAQRITFGINGSMFLELGLVRVKGLRA